MRWAGVVAGLILFVALKVWALSVDTVEDALARTQRTRGEARRAMRDGSKNPQ
jgi:hypothetical protein